MSIIWNIHRNCGRLWMSSLWNCCEYARGNMQEKFAPESTFPRELCGGMNSVVMLSVSFVAQIILLK